MMWMKKCLFLFVILMPVFAFSQTISEIEKSNYVSAVSDYFEQDMAVVNKLIENKVALEEIPVILFISGKTKVSPDKIAGGTQSWQDVITSNNLTNDMFYFTLTSDFKSKVYHPIFSKFKAFNSKATTPVMLDNTEIINMVNLQFIMKHYDYNVFEIMAMRDFGKSFTRINADVKMLNDKLAREAIEKERKEAKEKKESDE